MRSYIVFLIALFFLIHYVCAVESENKCHSSLPATNGCIMSLMEKEFDTLLYRSREIMDKLGSIQYQISLVYVFTIAIFAWR